MGIIHIVNLSSGKESLINLPQGVSVSTNRASSPNNGTAIWSPNSQKFAFVYDPPSSQNPPSFLAYVSLPNKNIHFVSVPVKLYYPYGEPGLLSIIGWIDNSSLTYSISEIPGHKGGAYIVNTINQKTQKLDTSTYGDLTGFLR
jgi:hypothetical protein